jgi:hypothetical protein
VRDWTRPWGWSSGSTSGAGSEPTRAIKVPWGMVTEELPLALGGATTITVVQMPAGPKRHHLRGPSQDARISWLVVVAVRCWPRSENGEHCDEIGDT